MHLRPAFTLIELLVVISIIAILASMLFATMGMIQNQAKKLQCLTNLRQLALAANAYANDNDGILNPCNKPGGTTFDVILAPFVGETVKLFWCPTNREARFFSTTLDGHTWTGRRSYAMPWSWVDCGTVSWNYGPGGEPGSVAVASIQAPSESILFAERHDLPNDPIPTENHFGNGWGDALDNPYVIRERHFGNTTNFGFADGHASSHKLAETMGIGTVNSGAWFTGYFSDAIAGGVKIHWWSRQAAD